MPLNCLLCSYVLLVSYIFMYYYKLVCKDSAVVSLFFSTLAISVHACINGIREATLKKT